MANVKVRMLVSMTGPMPREPGQVIEVSAAEAERLIASGFAEPFEEVETATAEPPEKAVLPRSKRRKKG